MFAPSQRGAPSSVEALARRRFEESTVEPLGRPRSARLCAPSPKRSHGVQTESITFAPARGHRADSTQPAGGPADGPDVTGIEACAIDPDLPWCVSIAARAAASGPRRSSGGRLWTPPGRKWTGAHFPHGFGLLRAAAGEELLVAGGTPAQCVGVRRAIVEASPRIRFTALAAIVERRLSVCASERTEESTRWRVDVAW